MSEFKAHCAFGIRHPLLRRMTRFAEIDPGGPMNRFASILRSLGLLLALASTAAFAALPATISFQGYVASPAGVPVNSPSFAMTFALFAAPTFGTALWHESQSVAVTSGVFNVALGAGTLLSGAPLASLPFDAPYWLEVTADGGTLAPRTALASVPYAFRALSLEPGAPVGGVVPPSFMVLGNSSDPPPGFDLVGPFSGYFLFARQAVGQAIQPSVPSLNVSEGVNGSFTARLALAPVASVTVSVTSSATATATVSPTNLTFTSANYATPQAVTVSGVQDSNLVTDAATVTLAAPGIPTVQVPVTVADNNVQAIFTSVPSLTVGEGGTATFATRPSFMPAGNITITVSSGNPGAATTSPATLSFTPATWDTAQAVTVTGVQDANLTNETVSVTLSTPGAANTTVTVTVADDDTQAIQRNMGTLTVVEGGTASFAVSLAYQPAANVTVSVSSSNTGTATASPTTLTFGPGNYAIAQQVTVTGVTDGTTGNRMATINLTALGAVPNSVFITVTDP